MGGLWHLFQFFVQSHRHLIIGWFMQCRMWYFQSYSFLLNPKQFHVREVPGCRVTLKQWGRKTVKKGWARRFQRKQEQSSKTVLLCRQKEVEIQLTSHVRQKRDEGDVKILWRHLKGSIFLKWGSHCFFSTNGKGTTWPVNPSAHLVWSSESSHQAVEVI